MTGFNIIYDGQYDAYTIFDWTDASGTYHEFDTYTYVFNVGDLPGANQPITFDGSGNTVIPYIIFSSSGSVYQHTLMLHRVTPSTQLLLDTGFDSLRNVYYQTVTGPYTEDVSNSYNQPITPNGNNIVARIYGMDSFSFITSLGDENAYTILTTDGVTATNSRYGLYFIAD